MILYRPTVTYRLSWYNNGPFESLASTFEAFEPLSTRTASSRRSCSRFTTLTTRAMKSMLLLLLLPFSLGDPTPAAEVDEPVPSPASGTAWTISQTNPPSEPRAIGAAAAVAVVDADEEDGD